MENYKKRSILNSNNIDRIDKEASYVDMSGLGTNLRPPPGYDENCSLVGSKHLESFLIELEKNIFKNINKKKTT